MFTGIVREVGKILQKQLSDEGAVFRLGCSPELYGELEVGHSVSIDGVCLTVSHKSYGAFEVEATPETLRLTNLGGRETGDQANLEPAAKWSDFIGGHLVQGHADGTGRVACRNPEGNSWIFEIEAPLNILEHCVLKGSVAVNGVSLTLSGLNSNSFEVTIIPHTFQVTNFRLLEVGGLVNLEADLISKYVEQHVDRLTRNSAQRDPIGEHSPGK